MPVAGRGPVTMFSLIIPVRDWPADRIEACVASFLRLKSAALDEIVVVDFGSKRPPQLTQIGKSVRIVAVPAKRWSLAEAINVGVLASRNPVVAKVDADIVVARESGPGLDDAVAWCGSSGGMAIVRTVDLPEGVDAKTAIEAETADLLVVGRLRPRWGQGGLCVFSVAGWNAIGGFDARFHGWGNEDNDFANRMRRSGRRMRWAPTEAVRIFHVWHPPSYIAKDIVKARSDNRRIFVDDKSTFRSVRFLSCRAERIASPNVACRPRPLVTVAIASKARKNRVRMLTEAIGAFRGQMDNDFEVLIADNGSNEEQRAALAKALARLGKRLPVRHVHLDKASIPAARNLITDEAHGRYVCVADDDDIALPNRLGDHLACFTKDPAIHGSHGGWIDFDELTGIVEYNAGGERTLSTLLFGRGKVTAHPASFYRRDVLQAVRYDESIRAGSDLDLAVRMANLGCRIGHTASYVTLRRFHDANVTLTDLGCQLAVGVESRQRVRETFGSAYEAYLREQAKDAQTQMPCGNVISRERIAEMMPSYAGVWRVLVPLAEFGRGDVPAIGAPAHGGNGADGDVSNGSHPLHDANGATVLFDDGDAGDSTARESTFAGASMDSDLMERANQLSELFQGDVGVIDSGINPALYVVSHPIKGTTRALKLRREIEERLGVTSELMPNVDYQRRRSQRPDWAKIVGDTAAQRLASAPTRNLGDVLTALARIPDGTMLRAMTGIASDFNCEDQLFRMVTAPIRDTKGLRGVKRMLERYTDERFEILAEERPQ